MLVVMETSKQGQKHDGCQRNDITAEAAVTQEDRRTERERDHVLYASFTDT